MHSQRVGVAVQMCLGTRRRARVETRAEVRSLSASVGENQFSTTFRSSCSLHLRREMWPAAWLLSMRQSVLRLRVNDTRTTRPPSSFYFVTGVALRIAKSL